MLLLPCFRALHIAATLLVGGALAFEFLILARAQPQWRDAVAQSAMARCLKRLCAWGVIVGLLSWIAWLAAIAIAMSGLPASQALTPDVLGTVVGRTTFGHVWSIRLALFVLLAVLLLLPRSGSKRAGIFAFAVSVALVGSLAWTGHALGTSRIHVWIDALHLLAAGAWLGMLPPLLRVTSLAVTQPAAWRDIGIASAKRFFLPGVIAVLVLAASGLANTTWMIGSPVDLVDTEYGRVLSTKLALFALMLVLAAANRLVIIPQVERAGGSAGALRSLHRSVLAELVLGAAVLAVVAWLGVTPPVGHDMGHSMENM